MLGNIGYDFGLAASPAPVREDSSGSLSLAAQPLAPTHLLERLPASISGPLSKKGRLLGRWKRYQFALRGTILVAEKSSTTLRLHSAALADKSSAAAAELVVTGQRLDADSGKWSSSVRSVQLRAESHEEARRWVAAMCKALERHALISSEALDAMMEPVRKLGAGGYGTVALVQSRRCGEQYALKAITKRIDPSQRKTRFERLRAQRKHTRYVSEERAAMQWASRHPHVVTLHAAFETSSHYLLGMEFCAGGELFKLLRKQPNRRFSEDVVRVWAAQLFSAVQHLHSLGIMHRDIKPENIFLDADGNAHLGDFGLARILGQDGRTHSFCGTKYYMAPEVLRGDRAHGVAVDMWALGVLLFELLTGKPPFKGKTKKDTFALIAHAPLRFPSDVDLSSPVRDLITRLLVKWPHSRFGVGGTEAMLQVRAHKFFAGIDWDAVDAGNLPSLFVPDPAAPAQNDDASDGELSLNHMLGLSSAKALDESAASLHGFHFVNDFDWSCDDHEGTTAPSSPASESARLSSGDAADDVLDVLRNSVSVTPARNVVTVEA